MWVVAVSRRGQLVLPKEVRERVGLVDGGRVDIEVENHRILLNVPQSSGDTPLHGFLEWEGSLRGSSVVDDLLREHADEVSRAK